MHCLHKHHGLEKGKVLICLFWWFLKKLMRPISRFLGKTRFLSSVEERYDLLQDAHSWLAHDLVVTQKSPCPLFHWSSSHNCSITWSSIPTLHWPMQPYSMPFHAIVLYHNAWVTIYEALLGDILGLNLSCYYVGKVIFDAHNAW
jgi:hypothetical protein